MGHRMFSRRVPAEAGVNALTRAVTRARASGTPLIDLTVSNPTRVGIEYPPDLLRALSTPAAHRYEPHSRSEDHTSELQSH